MLCHVECTYTWENHDERNEELEETCENKTLLSLIDALRSKTLLDDVLVESPVTEVCKPESTYESHETRYVCEGLRVVRFLDHKMEVGIVCILTCCKGCVNVSETLESSTVSGSLESEERCDETTTNEEHHLHHVSPCN